MATKTNKKVVLVTGSNQGLGFEIIHVLALREPDSIYMLCSRDLVKGQEALGKLRELGVKSEIEVLKFDVTDDSDIQSAVDFVSGKYGKLDVLVNNAGISPLVKPPKDESPAAMREAYSYLINTNLISVYIISKAFLGLLQKGKEPKVVNVGSGLGSMEFNLKSPMVRGHRSVEYGSSKVGLNGVTTHMQAGENDRCGVFWKEDGEVKGWGKVEEEKEGYVRFYVAQPGILKTAFNGFRDGAKSPELGAEVIARLVVDGQGGKYYPGGTYWKCDVDVMEEVPW